MLLTLLGFVCVGIKLFLQQHNKKLIVNSKQQKHSLIGLVSQTLLQVWTYWKLKCLHNPNMSIGPGGDFVIVRYV